MESHPGADPRRADLPRPRSAPAASPRCAMPGSGATRLASPNRVSSQPPCFAAPRRPWDIRVLELQIPGYASHDKGLQRQIGDSPLVSSQEQRALAVPQVNRMFCSSSDLNRTSFVRASEESSWTVVFHAPRVKRVSCLLGGPTRWCPVPSHNAPPRRHAPPRHALPSPDPPVEYPGFGLDRFLMVE